MEKQYTCPNCGGEVHFLSLELWRREPVLIYDKEKGKLVEKNTIKPYLDEEVCDNREIQCSVCDWKISGQEIPYKLLDLFDIYVEELENK